MHRHARLLAGALVLFALGAFTQANAQATRLVLNYATATEFLPAFAKDKVVRQRVDTGGLIWK